MYTLLYTLRYYTVLVSELNLVLIYLCISIYEMYTLQIERTLVLQAQTNSWSTHRDVYMMPHYMLCMYASETDHLLHGLDREVAFAVAQPKVELWLTIPCPLYSE